MAILQFSDMGTPDGEARTRQDIVRSLHEAVTNTAGGLERLPAYIEEAIEHRVWEQDRLFSGGTRQGPVPFDQFVTAPYPTGLGTTLDVIRALLSACPNQVNATRARDMIDRARKTNEGGVNNREGRNQHTSKSSPKEVTDNIVNSDQPKRKSPVGNAADAGLRRIRKEAESGNDKAKEALNDVLAERKTINQAAIELGHRRRTVTVPDEPAKIIDLGIKRSGALEAAKRAWGQMTPAEREEFIAWVSA